MKKKILFTFIVILLSVIAFGIMNVAAAETVNVSNVSALQSAHPYTNNMDKTWIYTHSTPAESLEISFSSDTETETGYDFIYIFDGNDNQIGKYAGTSLAGTTITVPGNVVKIRLTTDISVQKNGFTVTSIKPNIVANIVAEGKCGDNLTWQLYDSGKMTISGSGTMYNYTPADNQFAPWYNRRTIIKEVEIQNGVTSIGERAFYQCESLTSIAIPDSVTSIEMGLFYGCRNLTNIVIPDSVTSIGTCAFYQCESLTSIAIPDSVTSIGPVAFGECSSIASVIIPDSVTSIEMGLFSRCRNLTNIVIPDSVTSIGAYAFEECDSLKSITIPDSVTSIGNSAFRICSSLTDIIIPNSVISLGCSVFFDCDSLAHVYYKGTEEEWNSISIDDGNENLTSEIISYNYNSMLKYLTYRINNGEVTITDCYTAIQGEWTIPSTIEGYPVTNIGDYAFSSCRELTSVTIPDSVTSLGQGAFSSCENLVSITIGNGVINIGDWAFYDCESLTSITIPDSVTSIGEHAFSGCESLESITIGNGVTDIGSSAFFTCDRLARVNITDLSAWCNINFSDSSANPLYYAKKLYLQGTLVSNLIIPEGVTSIGTLAFYECDSLTSITIPDSVTSIGKNAFYQCESLESIVIGNGVTSIGESAFDCCRNLVSVTIGDGITSIDKNAFGFCWNIDRVNITNLDAWFHIRFYSMKSLFYHNILINSFLPHL